jgi:hypothetical protein
MLRTKPARSLSFSSEDDRVTNFVQLSQSVLVLLLRDKKDFPDGVPFTCARSIGEPIDRAQPIKRASEARVEDDPALGGLLVAKLEEKSPKGSQRDLMGRYSTVSFRAEVGTRRYFQAERIVLDETTATPGCKYLGPRAFVQVSNHQCGVERDVAALSVSERLRSLRQRWY